MKTISAELIFPICSKRICLEKDIQNGQTPTTPNASARTNAPC